MKKLMLPLLSLSMLGASFFVLAGPIPPGWDESTYYPAAQDCLTHTPRSKPDSRYTYNQAGDEVTDTVTQLTWRRCTEGRTWVGTRCTGFSNHYTWSQVLAHAASQTGWRIPNVKEAMTLVDTSCFNPAKNKTAFPGFPSHWIDHRGGVTPAPKSETLWTSTPAPAHNSIERVYYVSLAVGWTEISSKDKLKLNLRLVRDAK